MSIKYQVVVAACILYQGKVLIAQREPGDKLEGRYELPGGKVEEYEKLEDTLHREIMEELGIVINIGRLFHAFINHLNNDNVILFYTAYLSNHEEVNKLYGTTAIFVDHDEMSKYDVLPGSFECIAKLTPADVMCS